jgi:hypothetical protein
VRPAYARVDVSPSALLLSSRICARACRYFLSAGVITFLLALAGPAAAAVALVARVGALAAVAERLLRTVPVEANRPLASRFNCLAMLTLVILL